MKLTRLAVALAVFLTLMWSAGACPAAMEENSVHVSPLFGYYFFEGDQNVDNGFTAGLGAGYNFTRNWGFELLYNYVSTEDDRTGGDADSHVFQLDGLYHFDFSDKLVPYLAVGLGHASVDYDVGGDDDGGLANWGGGVKYFLNDTVALRADVRHLWVWDDPDNNLSALVGLTFQFPIKKKTPPPPPEPCADVDADGVCDDVDKCLGTPSGAAVDASGCCLDDDGDGVCNYKDKCPGTPPGFPVDAEGCCVDADGDGVCNPADECPGTPARAKVDAKGCPVILTEEVSIELRVLFDTAKWDIKPKFHDELKRVADFLAEYVTAKAVIEGHTDSRGSERYNQKLSYKRANSVREYLIENFGIAPHRLEAVGYGESRPVADNSTEEGRQRNRRVVAVFSAMKETMVTE